MSALERVIAGLEAGGHGPRLLRSEPVSAHTSFQVGGPADLLIAAETVAELVAWVRLARAEGLPCTVLGSGTNVLVADAGIRGLVILNACRSFTLEADGRLRAESGVLLRDLARHTVSEGWQGLEWAVGIPGTIGGAVVGNAGAYGGYMADVVLEATLLTVEGQVQRVGLEGLGFGYRTSALKRADPHRGRPIVLEAVMQLRPGDAAELAARAESVTQQRQARTPAGACAGSMFKRTEQYPAGFLIEQAGLKGLAVGSAQVSPIHANFVMNCGGATAQDIAQLVKIVQERVWQELGQRLEPEIEFLGEWTEAPIKEISSVEEQE
jgi:UDP-N-acetylmuramate dehydrogenase